MAQLSLELAEYKAQASMQTVIDRIKEFATSPMLEHAELFRRLLFCFLTGNCDMHLKNWSLSYSIKSGMTKLSPVYDFVNVRASYPQEQVELILAINNKQKNISKSDFVAFARSLNLNQRYLDKTFAQLELWYQTITQFCDVSALTPELKRRYTEVVKGRYGRLVESKL